MNLKIFKEVRATVPRKKIITLFNDIFADNIGEKTPGEVHVIFATDERMKELNKRFRGKNKSTDVLSFNIDQPKHDYEVFGEVYISVSIAEKQASDYDATLAEEFLRLCCHGFLHLLGYDHIKQKDAAKMKEAEEFYLNRL